MQDQREKAKVRTQHISLLCLLSLLLLIMGCVEISSDNHFKANVDAKNLFNDSRVAVYTSSVINSSDEFSVASWNLQVFGDKKSSDAEVMSVINDTVTSLGFDIVFFQEIRDSSGVAWERLCSMFKSNGFNCKLSSRAGSTSMKEQIGMIYNHKLMLADWQDYNFEPFSSEFERPPIMATFQREDYALKVLSIHVDPDNVKNELEALEAIANNESGNVMVIGDLNADCDYYLSLDEPEFDTWWWGIPAIADTTSSNGTDCAYDRVIVNMDARKELRASGVWVYTGESVSDHYLVWGKFRLVERGVFDIHKVPVEV